MRFLITCTMAACVCLIGCCLDAAAAEPLRYRFQDTQEAVYDVSIRLELPDAVETHSGQISYTIKSVDPDNGQITLGYSKSLRVERKSNEPANGRFPHGPAFGRRISFSFAAQSPAEIIIDPQGKLIRTNRAGDEDQLPAMLGLSWQLLLPALPPDEKPWKSERAVSLYNKRSPGNSWPPAPPWERQDEDRTDRSAHETITESVGEPNAENMAPVTRQFELATDEKVDDVPVTKATSRGTILFDTQRGLVQSLELKQTIEVNQKNLMLKVPVTVSARLLNADEVAKLKAEQAVAAAKAKEAADKARARFALEHANEVRELPAGCVKTAVVGGNGGGPFIKIHKDRRPVIGFSIRIGSWRGHTTIGHAEPLFEQPADLHPEGATICLAKEGYVVGGIIVNKRDGADGLQIIFMKQTSAGVDPTNRYLSPQFGLSEGTTPTQLASKGQRVIGTFGRQGVNMDAIGLVLSATDPDNAAETVGQ